MYSRVDVLQVAGPFLGGRLGHVAGSPAPGGDDGLLQRGRLEVRGLKAGGAGDVRHVPRAAPAMR